MINGKLFLWSLFVFLIAVTCWVVAVLLPSATMPPQSTRGLQMLFTMHTFDGQSIQDRKLPVLVEIIDAEDSQAAEWVWQVERIKLKRPFAWIIVTTGVRNLSEKVGVLLGKPYWIEMDVNVAKQLLGHETVGDQWLLFDENMTLRTFGNFVHGGMQGELASLVDNAPSFSPQIIQLRLAQASRADIRQFVSTQPTSNNHTFYLLVRAVSSGCGIGDKIREFDQAAAINLHDKYSILVPASWSAAEISALQTNLEVNHAQIKTASLPVSQVWDQMAEEFGNLRMNGVLFSFSPDNIEHIYTDAHRISAVLKGETNAE